MQVYQEVSVVNNTEPEIDQVVVPKVIQEEKQPMNKGGKSSDLTSEEIQMKEEAEEIIKSSMERLLIADKLGIDIAKPKETMKLYRHAYLQSNFQDALKFAKKIGIESAQIWNLTLKKRIELAKSGQVDPTVTAVPPAGQDAQDTGPKVPTVVKPGTKKREPPRPKVVATRKIIFANGKNNGKDKKAKKKTSMVESLKSFFGKKENSSIEERLSRAEMMLNRAKGLEKDEDNLSMESLDERMAKIESEIQKKIKE